MSPEKSTVEPVFEIVVVAEVVADAVGRQHLRLVEHDELRRVPRLAGAADPAPDFVVSFVEPTSHEVIAGGFGGDGNSHGFAAGGELRVDGLATGESDDEQCDDGG